MKTLKALGVATLLAATATTAAYAGDDDAASQTPFVYGEAQSQNVAVTVGKGFGLSSDDAAAQTPFVYDEAESNSVVTRASTSDAFATTPVTRAREYTDDDAAAQTPFLYEE